jgi:hypothetical protein
MNTKSLTRWGVVLAAGSMLLPGLWAVDAPLVGDTYVSAAAPGNNYGPATNIVIAPGNAGLVQFDLTAIPASSTIAKAYLCVYVNKVTAAGTLDFALPTSSWAEGTVTLSSVPTAGSVFSTALVSVANTFILVDVTAAAQAWLASPSTNFGIEITGESSTSVQLDTKESAATSHPAELELSIVGPAGATGATGPTGATGGAGYAGAAGATGAAGPSGATGPLGATGAAGPTGVAGGVGANGAVGLAGALGPTGAAGPTGVAGAAGATGAAGLAGPRGASGPAGPTGAAGATGAVGLAGAPGPTGAPGANGPSGNQFTMDTTLHNSPYTIPDTDTYLYYLTNNPPGTASTCGGAVTMFLPHSTTVGAGRMVIISPGNVPNATAAQCPGVAVAAQSGDTVVPSGVNADAHPLVVVSDGAGHWIIINNTGS